MGACLSAAGRGRRWYRLILAAAFATAGGCLALHPFPTALAKRGHHPQRQTRAALNIRVLDSAQRPIIRRNRIRVRLRARRGGLVRAYVVIRPQNRGAAAIVITRTATVRLRARRWKTVKLRLAGAGRSVLSGCGPGRALQARAGLLRGARQIPGRQFQSGRRRLRVAKGFCAHVGATRRGTAAQPIAFDAANADRCDVIDPAVCLQPFPNDFFTVSDSSTATGRRVNLNSQSTPANKSGVHIDPSDINRNDGFSPGSPIVTHVPGMDNPKAFARTGAVPITDLRRTYAKKQPVLVINTRTLQRQLIWSEIDSNPTSRSDVNLIIRPGVNLQEGVRYIVALRNMRDANGRILKPSAGFRLFRDRTLTTNSSIEKRRDHFESLFDTLAKAGVDRDSLYVAWDFTVASERSLSERQLAIRNDAYRQLGDTNLTDLTVQGRAPSFQVTKVTDNPSGMPEIARQVEGTYTVPCYLDLPGCPSGSRFLYSGQGGTPTWIPGNTMTAKFTCNIPQVAMQQDGARPSLYGHGLFGSRGEVNQQQLQDMSQEHDFVFCATDWVGMACTDLPPSDPQSAAALFTDFIEHRTPPNAPDCDVPTAISDETDLSNFPTLVDRVDQAFVNFMYLGRLLIHPQGFAADPAFHDASNRSVLDTSHLYYDGNSQGGIFGGSLIALEPDITRGVIGVPGMNYSTLLQRSSDFGTGEPPNPNPTDPGSFIPQYAYPLYQSYPNQLERQLILSLMQQMWDHSDPDGLAHHMTSDPLPNTPAHTVLMQGGLGDHQVTQFAAQVEARTIGAHIHLPWAGPGRDPQRGGRPYGLPAITSYPYNGSAYVLFDIGPVRNAPCPPGDVPCGTPPPPTTNTPPMTGEDPHEWPRRSPAGRVQKSAFLEPNGVVIDVCGNRPCYAGAWTGP
jgi:hypothetical protein